MRIALIQAPLQWEDAEANRLYFESVISGLDQVDLVVLPEMFTTGFTMNPSDVAETMDGKTMKWITRLSQQFKTAITGSFAVMDNGNYWNRLVFVYPDGSFETYDKRHLFSLAKEGDFYAPGQQRLIVTYQGWRICPLVCYDLRFPVFSRNNENIDLYLYVASWPEKRIFAWDALLRARAIENMAYVVAVNRVGFDHSNFEYVGHSQAIDYMGKYLVPPFEEEAVKMVHLDYNKKNQAVQKLGFLNDQDLFQIL